LEGKNGEDKGVQKLNDRQGKGQEGWEVKNGKGKVAKGRKKERKGKEDTVHNTTDIIKFHLL